MPQIIITNRINAPAGVVFDLSRSINLHLVSASQTNEKAIAGKTSGLMELHDEVTWQATHLGIKQKLTVRITEYNRPYSFTDKMLKGAFKSMKHEHLFTEEPKGAVIMRDIFTYQSPLGLFGKIADALFLKNYMHRFLLQRNAVIKAIAEDPDKYKQLIF